MSNIHTFVAGATARQPERMVIGEGHSHDAVQASGAWIAIDAADVVEVEP